MIKPLTEVKQIKEIFRVRLNVYELEGTYLTLEKHQELYDRFYEPLHNCDKLSRESREPVFYELCFTSKKKKKLHEFNEWKKALTPDDVTDAEPLQVIDGDFDGFTSDDTWDYPGSPYLSDEDDIY